MRACIQADSYCRCCCMTVCVCMQYIQGVSRLVDITVWGDFLGICDQKCSYKHVSDFGRLRSYDRLKLRIEVMIIDNKRNKIIN